MDKKNVVVWHISGDPDAMLFDCQQAAEIYARFLFPEEDAHKRHQRIYYKQVHTLASLTKGV